MESFFFSYPSVATEWGQRGGVTRRQTLPTTHHKSVSVHECWVILLVAIPSFIMGYNPSKVKAKQTTRLLSLTHVPRRTAHTHTHTTHT